MKAGIVGYGVSFPFFRVDLKEINQIYPKNVDLSTVKGMGIRGRGVMGPDEDPITMAAEAAYRALEMSGISPEKIGALFVGSQTNPYTTKSMASVLCDMLLLGPDLMGGDCQFGGKSGSMALQAVWSMVESGVVEYGLVVATDALSLHIAPGNPLEYTAAGGAAAFVIGREAVLAEIRATASYMSDLTDYYRLDEERFLYWGGSAMSATAVGMPAHLGGAVKLLYAKEGLTGSDFTYGAFPQESKKKATSCAGFTGLAAEKLQAGSFAEYIGDCGSAAPFIALAKILETAKADESILMATYGYGAGSDAFHIVRTETPFTLDDRLRVENLGSKCAYVDYATALKYERKLAVPTVRITNYV